MRFDIDVKEVERLQNAMKSFQGNTENAINEILHNDAKDLIQDEIRRLMPVSGITWKGKRPPAKKGKSLTDERGNLSITVKTTNNYHYLYFPDLGTNTTHHVGKNGVPLEFFRRGGENKQSEIINRCIVRLVEDFEKT